MEAIGIALIDLNNSNDERFNDFMGLDRQFPSSRQLTQSVLVHRLLDLHRCLNLLRSEYCVPQIIIVTSRTQDPVSPTQSVSAQDRLCAVGCVCQQVTDGLNLDLFGSNKNLSNSV